MLAHGDGLGEGDWGYRLLLKPFLRSAFTRTVFGLLPASVGDRIAGRVSRTEDRWDEWGDLQRRRSDALEAWAVEELRSRQELELVLLGHTHGPMVREVGPGQWYVNSGDWVFHRSYVTLCENEPPRLSEWEAEGS